MNKLAWMWIVGYVLLMVALCSCSYPKVVTVPRPTYPVMKEVKIQGKVIQGKYVQHVVDNMLNMSRLIDELYLAPCYEEE